MQNNMNRHENGQQMPRKIQSGPFPMHTSSRHIRLNKKVLIGIVAIFTITCIGILCYANFARSCEGIWVRMEDDSYLQGMTVEIKKENGAFEGVIVAMGETTHPFHVGQVKWSDFRKTGIGKYTCYDLFYDYESDAFYNNETPTQIIVESGGKGLILANERNEGTGNYQRWEKLTN